jgi:hypothetical protein
MCAWLALYLGPAAIELEQEAMQILSSALQRVPALLGLQWVAAM